MDGLNDDLMIYRDAVLCLEAAAGESQKTSNVDIAFMLLNINKCSQIVEVLLHTEDYPVRMSGLQQLKETLTYQTEILKAKISQLDNERHGKSPEEKVVKDSADKRNGISVSDSKESKSDRQLAIEETIITKGKVTFQEIAGLHEAKQSLKEAIILPLKFPHLFTGGRKPWCRILLYGPPGTGKSRLAQAVSSEIDSYFYSVSSSDLVSSWVGESEKLIKELFHHARNHQGRSVVFIDEIDSICRQRSSREEEYTRRIKTELLKQMEGADNTETLDKIFLLCATNCPWELDSAFLRRFQKRIYIPLPDRDARISLMKIHTRNNDLSLCEDAWSQLADKTVGYSGSDLATMILGALLEPIRDLQTASTWIFKGDKYLPCPSNCPGAITAEMTSLPSDQIQPREVCLDDFLKSLTTHRNTVTPEELIKFATFTSTFGQNG